MTINNQKQVRLFLAKPFRSEEAIMGSLAGCFVSYLRFIAWVSIVGVLLGVFALFTFPNPLFGIMVIIACAIIGVCFFLLTDLQRWSRGSVICFIGFCVCQLTLSMVGSVGSGST